MIDTNKYLKNLTLNFWQHDKNTIKLTVQNPYKGEQGIISSIEHTDKHGEAMARTHNNLFTKFKEILIANNKWNDNLMKKEKKRKNISSKIEGISSDSPCGFIYITTNLVNGMQYIGKHTKFGDNYLGSGTFLKEAIKELGEENFEREILAYGYTPEHLNDLEQSYIKIFNAVQDPQFYNIAPGGDWHYPQKDIK
ncbi:TPA: GIY-YIG nuclease family protein [Bacillus paranthracis]|nr:GIY-YIG nuclease family protein [Bacillus paranthracis]